MKKFFAVIAFAFAFVSVLSAQQKQVVINHDYMGFSGIAANDYFEINIVYSDTHAVKITASSSIEEYVQAYVKSGVLHLNIDEKSMSSELKKEFKAKNSVISKVQAEISMHSLRSIALSGNSVVEVSDTLAVDKLNVALSKTGLVKRLNVVAKSSVLVDLAGKSNAYMAVKSPALEICASNGSRTDMNIETKKLTLSTNGSAKVELYGKAEKISISTEGNSKVEFNSK